MIYQEEINKLGKSKTPFLFIIDFEMAKPIVLPLDQLANSSIQFEINGQNRQNTLENIPDFTFEKYPYSFEAYLKEFEGVHHELKQGNSFLVNLTTSTPISISLSLEEIYRLSRAKYKLLLQDQFVCFSPETFIKIENNEISTYPMKGTIDANLPHAEKKLLENLKEKAEHTTIVDLLRNDLSKVAKNVTVENFRYIEKISTHYKHLLQASSKIKGKLPSNFHENLGDILVAMLPAGSISGAPKPKTLEIIKKVEQQERGYYTGIFGVFDGENLDSAVMIRFIEQRENQLYFRSGGGIHVLSNPQEEYQELIDKIYVPIY